MQRRKGVALFAVFLLSVIGSAMGVFADELPGNDKLNVEVNILAPVVRINVPDGVFLGNVTKGYSSERVRVNINNTGTTAVRVTPRLKEGSDEVFNNIMFARRVSETFLPVGEFSIDIDRPSEIGKVENDYFYVKMDLEKYNGRIGKDMIKHRAEVVFWAMER